MEFTHWVTALRVQLESRIMYGRMRDGVTPVLNAVRLLLMVSSAVLALTMMRGPKGNASSHSD